MISRMGAFLLVQLQEPLPRKFRKDPLPKNGTCFVQGSLQGVPLPGHKRGSTVYTVTYSSYK